MFFFRAEILCNVKLCKRRYRSKAHPIAWQISNQVSLDFADDFFNESISVNTKV